MPAHAYNPRLGRLRQEDPHRFQASLATEEFIVNYIVRPSFKKQQKDFTELFY